MSTAESPAAYDDGSPAASVEVLLERVAHLVCERQSLRAGAAGRSALERNRAEISRVQWQLSHALIARYSPSF